MTKHGRALEHPPERPAGDRAAAGGLTRFPMIRDTVTLDVRMDRIVLSVPPGPEFHGALRLVVGGIGARSQLGYEQVNELQLAVETVVAQRRPAGSALVVRADVDDRSVSLLVGPFEPEDDPPGFHVAERLVGSFHVVTLEDGQWLELSSTNERAGAAT